ncbi:MAG TPA: ethanolamine ammonia-lyase subunit EutC [Schlesneria sp.]|jgi:ethanolamine ammonia-lyase small subunit
MSTSADPWHDFKSLTAARIALGRAGGSLPTRELLDFGLSQARARDAVLASFDADRLIEQLSSDGLETISLSSDASSREEYLRRPDLGRRLDAESREELASLNCPTHDLCLIISDGLSSHAAVHAGEVATRLIPLLKGEGWCIAPVVIIPFARVAIQDEVGHGLKSAISLILLGERPGLGSPDSLGAYFVYGPKPGRTDADRNCLSNIRPGGLPPSGAVIALHYLLNAARHRRISGISLKDERLLSAPIQSILEY